MAVTHLGALTERLTRDLASLRQLVIAAAFDGAAAAGAIRQVSATLTTYAGLEQTLEACEATATLRQRSGQLRARAETMLAGSLSARITDTEVHWGAAVRLVGLLADTLALSQAAQGVAAGLGISIAVATDPRGPVAPGGSQLAGASWADFASWSDAFWPVVSSHAQKLKAAAAKNKTKVTEAETAKLVDLAATGRDWLAVNEPWPCYRSYWQRSDGAVDAYEAAAAAYARHDDAAGTKLLRKADGLLTKLAAVARDRFQVRCELDPAAPG